MKKVGRCMRFLQHPPYYLCGDLNFITNFK